MKRLAVLCLAAAAAAIAYGPCLALYFHGDDFEWLHAARAAAAAPGLQLPRDVNGHFRPLAEALWLVDYRWHGLEPLGYHARGLVLHVLTAVAVFLIAHELLGSLGGALAAGLLFGVNAVFRSTPTWPSAAPDQLLGLLGAVAVLAWRRGGGLRWAALAAVALALLAKETALVLPAALLLVGSRSQAAPGFRFALLALAASALVPHLVATALSSYVVSRFGVGGGGGLPVALDLPAGLLAPGLPMGGAGALVRILLALGGTVALLLAVGLAGIRIGRRAAACWLLAALIAAAPALFARSALEPRWLYLPWVFLATLLGAALLGLIDLAGRREGGRRTAAAAAVALVALHVVAHGALLRLAIGRALSEQAWVRALVEAARRAPAGLEDGSELQVIVPFGSELRYWPLGIQLAMGKEVVVVPVDDRTKPSPGGALLDASGPAPVWRRP